MTAYKAMILLGEGVGLLHSAKRQHSTIEDALETPQRDELMAVFAAMLTQQYKAIDPKRVLRGQDTAAFTNESQILPLVSPNLPPSADVIDYNEALILLLFFSGMGQELGFEDAPTAPTGAERINAQTGGRDWVAGRLNALLGISNQGQAGNIASPDLPQGLDETTARRIAGLIMLAIREAGEGATLTRIAEIYNSLIEGEVGNRASFIADDNASTALSNGQWVAVGALADQTAVAKKWLRTKSRVPRQEHLDQVGVVVPFNSVFPSGESWSQELPNCKCGIEVIYASGSSREFRL